MTLVSKPEKCENKGIFMPRIIWSLNGAGAQQPLRRRFDASAPERTFLFGRCIVKECPQCGEKGFYHWSSGYGSWCEICGYSAEKEMIEEIEEKKAKIQKVLGRGYDAGFLDEVQGYMVFELDQESGLGVGYEKDISPQDYAMLLDGKLPKTLEYLVKKEAIHAR